MRSVRTASVIAGSVLLTVGGALFAPPANAAATLDVCPVGCTYSTITAAVAVAAAGDTVTVGAGTYNENSIKLTKAITIQGAGQGNTIVDGGGGVGTTVGIFQIRPAAPATSGTGTMTVKDMSVVNPAKFGSFYMDFSIGMKQASTGVSDITLDNLNVEGTNDTAKPGYGVYADSGVTSGVDRVPPTLNIKNSTFSKTAYNNIGVDAWGGDVNITNNDLVEGLVGNSAIVVLNEYSVEQITSSITVKDNRSNGRLFYLSNIGQVPDKPGFGNVAVSFNQVSHLGPGDPGIYIGTNTAMTAAKFRNGEFAATDNTITADAGAAGSHGVRIRGMLDHGLVEGNTITGTEIGVSAEPILGLAPTAVEVSRNSLAGDGHNTATTGVRIKGAIGSASADENDIFGWENGIEVAPDDADQPTAVGVLHNRIFGDANGLANSSTTSVTADENWWGCQESPTNAANAYCSTVTGPVTLTNWFATEATSQKAANGDGTVHVTPGEHVGIDVSFVKTDGTTATTATGLPSIFENLPVAYAADRGAITGGADLGTSYTGTSEYVAPATAGPDQARVAVDHESFPVATVRALGDTEVTGEPVPIDFTVESAGGGTSGGGTGTGTTASPTNGVSAGTGTSGVSALPDTGAEYPAWLPWIGLALVLGGLSLTRRRTAVAVAFPGQRRLHRRHRR